jgi:SET domain
MPGGADCPMEGLADPDTSPLTTASVHDDCQKDIDRQRLRSNSSSSSFQSSSSSSSPRPVPLPRLDDSASITTQQQQQQNHIFSLAFSHRAQNGGSFLQHPPVRVVRVSGCRGNTLIATHPFAKGEVIFTERAALASQTNSTTVTACQACFRSLEPPDSVFPMAEEFWGFEPASPACCPTCSAPFCSSCHQKKGQLTRTDCCRYRRLIVNKNPTCTIETALQLAFKMFVHLLWTHRSQTSSATAAMTKTQVDQTIMIDYTRGLCGSADDLPLLDLADDDSFQDLYHTMVQAYDMTEREQMVLSLQRLEQLVAVASRNGVAVRTQSPFQPYYAAILRRYGRNSNLHVQLQHAVVQLLSPSSSTESLDNDDDDHETVPPPSADPQSARPRLRRGMDRELNERYAPEVVALFPLIARINHSCDPNAQIVSQVFVDYHVDVCAVKPIAVGEEITISYLPTTIQRRERRRQLLQARYLFECECPRCQKQAS